MKFHCDRCKTKYSISDDRVRGKILKIRCKNCSAVITVREEGAAAAKPAGSSQEAAASTSAGAEAQRAGQQALAGAFKKSVTEPAVDPGRSGSSAPPVSLEAEWYLSIDGEQEGPFSLQDARAWVQSKAAEDELHCWSEGYDDWLPTDKVSHFRSLRRAPSTPPPSGASVGGPGDDEVPTLADDQVLDYVGEETPKPLFAATMAAVESRTPGAASAEDIIPPSKQTGPFDSIPAAQKSSGLGREATEPSPNFGAGAPAIPLAAKQPARGPAPVASEEGPNLDFEIGEASRVVDLPALMASRGNAPVRPSGAIHQSAGLPGMGAQAAGAALGRGSGQESAISQASVAPGGHITGSVGALRNGTPMAGAPALDPAMDGVLLTPPTRKKRAGLHIPLIATGLLIAAVAIAMIIMLTCDDESGHVARGTVGGSGNLGYSFAGDPRRPKVTTGDTTGETPEVEEPKNDPQIRKNNTSKTNTNTTTNPKNTGTFDPNPTSDPDEVDLGSGTSTVATGPLDGDDLMQVYRKNSIAIKMCYERELKKNPLLKLPKTWVDIKVGLDGRVTGVTIPSLQGTPLGNCMSSRIARWKFRKTTEIFSSRFPVVFGS